MARVPVLFSMAKSNDATRKSQTHFEQVPIEVVTKIAEAEPQSAPARSIDRS
jgi:hypothetical protein